MSNYHQSNEIKLINPSRSTHTPTIHAKTSAT